jgi:hypothetical protein
MLLTQPLRAKPQAVGELQSEYERLTTQFAASVPGWRPERLATGSIVFVAPDQYAGVEQPDESFRETRNEHADALFELAKRAAEAGQLSLAFQWATEAVRENPDHADARRVLGYEERHGQWLTSYSARMADAGKTWHPEFGWTATDAAARREAGSDGWQVRTDNFLVTSNLSLEAAVELAARLERLHQVWRQLFAGFCLTEREVQQLFAGERQARQRHRPFRVFYHRDKSDYVAALQRRQPRIAETLGIYFDTDREAHFFAGEDQDAGTLYHEAVHQLFRETRPAARHVGGVANFWIIEGVATYFETLSEHRDAEAGLYYTIGQSTAGRLPAARHRLVEEGYYIPLAQLTQWGKDDLQRQSELAKVYSESAGLAAFLMDGDGMRYREPLVQYLQSVYAGRDDAETLAKFSGRGYDELDAEYRQFMESLPQ